MHLIEVSRYFHFVLIGAYFVLILNYLQHSNQRPSKANKNYFILCIACLLYSSHVAFITFGPFDIKVSLSSVIIGSILGFFSMYLTIAIYYELFPSLRFLQYARYGVLLISLVMTISLLEVVFFGTSWTLTSGNEVYLNPYFNFVFGHFVISNPAKGLLGIGLLVVLSSYIYTLVKLLTNPHKDRLLIFGIFFSLLVTTLDLLAGMNLNPWTFPLSCIGHLFEILRFQSGLIKSGNVASINLVDSLQRLTSLQAQSELSVILRHNLKNILIKNNIKDNTTNSTSQEDLRFCFELLQRLVQTPSNEKKSIHRVDISQTIDFCFTLTQGELKKRNILYENRIPVGNIVIGNDVDYTMVFTNLIQNSMEAFENQKAQLQNKYISIQSRLSSDSILIDYYDSAGGIPTELHQNIFTKPFSTKKNGEGLGLISIKETLLANKAIINHQNTDHGSHFEIAIFSKHNVAN